MIKKIIIDKDIIMLKDETGHDSLIIDSETTFSAEERINFVNNAISFAKEINCASMRIRKYD